MALGPFLTFVALHPKACATARPSRHPRIAIHTPTLCCSAPHAIVACDPRPPVACFLARNINSHVMGRPLALDAQQEAERATASEQQNKDAKSGDLKG
eukprot:4043738-Prymnesium_polylepis.2